MASIFISYSRSDAAVVDKLIGRLNDAGHQVWVDRTGIRGGEQWRQRIVNAIENAVVLVLVLSPNSVVSDNVRKELDLAESSKIPILPVAIVPVEIPTAMKYQLAGIQVIDLHRNFEAGLRELLGVLQERISAEIRPSPEPAIRPGQSGKQLLPGKQLMFWVGGGLLVVLLTWLVFSGILSSPPEVGVPSPSAEAVAMVSATAPPAASTSAFEPSPVPTSAPEPAPTQVTPAYPYPAPAGQVAEFPNGCLPKQDWRPYPSAGLLPPQGDCWRLPANAAFALFEDEISLFAQEVSGERSFGLLRFIPDNGNATMNLRLQIEKMDMPGEQIHNLSFGVVALAAESALQNGLFIQKERADFPILLKSTIFGDTYLKDANGKRYEYRPGSQVEVTLIVARNSLEIYVDGVRVREPLAVPSTDRAFWIGYFMRTRGTLQAQLTELEITAPAPGR